MSEQTLILGGGMTGLAAGIASGLPVIEAEDQPGGICLSYYMRPDSSAPYSEPLAPGASSGEDVDEAYRFENGGGHWIFGGDPVVLEFVRSLMPMHRYGRKSSVYFPKTGAYVPYPIQNNMRHIDQALAVRALDEMANPGPMGSTMAQWMTSCFGKTLGDLFFEPFNDLYTAGLYTRIAPQDGYKSPVNFSLALKGAFDAAPAVGYNTTYIYPEGGLNRLARLMAAQCDIHYGKRVTQFDTSKREVVFADGSRRDYYRVLSTLPLTSALAMAGLTVPSEPDPYTSVLVLNIGAVKGERCPEDHWLYIPSSDSGFHRVGFYSNVDHAFLPASARASGNRVSIYVERAYLPGARPNAADTRAYGESVVAELQRWGYIGAAEAVHPTWVDVAYTWSWPSSPWKQQAMQALEGVGIYQVGRYGRWIFQGIADSIRDGFIAGSSFKRIGKG